MDLQVHPEEHQRHNHQPQDDSDYPKGRTVYPARRTSWPMKRHSAAEVQRNSEQAANLAGTFQRRVWKHTEPNIPRNKSMIPARNTISDGLLRG